MSFEKFTQKAYEEQKANRFIARDRDSTGFKRGKIADLRMYRELTAEEKAVVGKTFLCAKCHTTQVAWESAYCYDCAWDDYENGWDDYESREEHSKA